MIKWKRDRKNEYKPVQTPSRDMSGIELRCLYLFAMAACRFELTELSLFADAENT
jgi:hypothetical protein